MNNSSPSPDLLFDAIQALDVDAIKDYIAQGGDLNVTSFTQRSALAEVALTLNKSLMLARQNSSSNSEDQTNSLTASIQEKVASLGTLLILNGAGYVGRMGKTNRTQTVSEFMAAKFPTIHAQWNALDSKKEMLEINATSLAAKDDAPPVRKKM